MLAFAQVISNSTLVQWFTDVRHFARTQSFVPVKCVDGFSIDSAEKFAFRICPKIFCCACNIARPWRNQGQQHVLVEREIIHSPCERLVYTAKPMRKCSGYLLQAFSLLIPCQGGTSFARFVRNDHGKSFIGSASPKCCLSQSRMTQYGNFRCIYITIGYKVIQGALKSPCPGGN